MVAMSKVNLCLFWKVDRIIYQSSVMAIAKAEFPTKPPWIIYNPLNLPKKA